VALASPLSTDIVLGPRSTNLADLQDSTACPGWAPVGYVVSISSYSAASQNRSILFVG
jgi:hypothetical protein